MKNAKLIQLLRTFKAKDFRRFREYLASPFFNKREDLRHFYAALEQFAPKFTPRDLSKEELWACYAPKRSLDEKELGYLLNFLLKHAENYLASEAFENDLAAKGTRVLAHCLNHGLDKHFRAVHHRCSKALSAAPYRDAEWQLKAWRLADAEVQRFYRSKSRRPDQTMGKAAVHLDAFYLDKKLEMTSETVNLHQIIQEEMDSDSVEGLLAFVKGRENLEASVQIRQLILNILKDHEDIGSFRALRARLPETPTIFPPDKVKGIFAYAQNFCIRRIKSGRPEYHEELFQIYRHSLQAKIMYEGEYLNPWNFKNVNSVALKLGEFDWAQGFMTEHGDHILPEFRESALAYNRANLHFHQKNYESALRTLMEVEFSDIFYALDTRRMMLMIYFERHDFDAFSSLASSFRIFLRRNQIISEKNRIAYKHFIDWAVRIYRERQVMDGKGLRQILKEIPETKPMVEGEWLMEKCREIVG